MKKLSYMLATLLSFSVFLNSFADTVNPVIDNSKADKTDSCWVVEVQLQNIFADVTTATDDSSSLGNGLTLVANPSSPQGGAAVDTRFQGTTSVTYTATDPSGNVTKQCINYVVKDYTNIGTFWHGIRYDHTVLRVGTPWYHSIKFEDSEDGDLTDRIVIDSSDFNANILGLHSISYSVTNSRDQTFEKTITIEVIDDLGPIIKAKNTPVVKVALNATYDPANEIILTDNYYSPSSLQDSLVIISNDLDLTTPGIYLTKFETTDGSGNKSDPYTLVTDVRTTLGIPNSLNNTFANVYPNPATDNVYIELQASSARLAIYLYDGLGKKVKLPFTKIDKGFSLDVSSLAKGLYFIEKEANGKVQREKVIVR